MRKALIVLLLPLVLATAAHAWEVQVWNEFARVGPDGKLLGQDWTAKPPEPLNKKAGPIRIAAARNSYVSLVLVVSNPEGGSFDLDVRCPPDSGVEADLYRTWYHRKKDSDEYVPDALVPVKMPLKMTLPVADNQIPNQTAQMFWLDLWISKRAKPGPIVVQVALKADGRRWNAPVTVEILPAALPDEDPIVADHNSYGWGWLNRQYPKLSETVGEEWPTSDRLFGLIHAYHRIFYEHRGTFHQLGYSHNGSVNRLFAPKLGGFGENRRAVSWDLFDRHYGPLLDGSAFAGTRRSPKPIPYVYLTINPEWPARFVLWGTPGYQAEFISAVRDMVRHFEQKGWTKTRFEMFFNHKKRYKAFPWDGDETRFEKDDAFFLEYGRLLHQALPRGTKVQIVFRHDASWQIARQWKTLDGVIDLWCCSQSMRWHPYAPKMLKDRGNIVWFYGGTPTAFEPSIMIVDYPLRAWMWKVDGYVRWLSISPGSDPWFAFEGGGTCQVYSGERFGIEEPIPSIRLKLERNAVQDVALLEMVAERIGADAARDRVAKLAGAKPADWWQPAPALRGTPPWTWSNATFKDFTKPPVIERNKLDGRFWLNVRNFAIETLTKEAR